MELDWGALTIPLFTGAIGYITNWSGVIMLFYPVHFKGVRIPGLQAIASALLPRRIQQIPGVMQGGLGWQGIIPSRAAKMGSVFVDTGIAKLGSPAEFYEYLEPEKIAQHILEASRDDMHDLVERVMEREHPQLWHELPPRVKAAVHARVQEQLPDVVREVTAEIGANINQLLDIKLMVIRRFEAEPELANRAYLDAGERELKFIQNFGFFFGLLLGIPMIFVQETWNYWWVIAIGGVVIGYVTNWVALWMIFEPVEPRKFGRFTLQGLFIKRQAEISDSYARIVAEDIVTLSNIGRELLYGPRSDRTRLMMENALRPALDKAVGSARGAVRVAVGAREYDAIRSSVATEGVDYAMTPMSDPEFSRKQGQAIRSLLKERVEALPPQDFSDMLRTAMREDEWLLLLHGAVLGFAAGLIHFAVFH